MDKKIIEFLKKSSKVFTRDYKSMTMLFSACEGYLKLAPKEVGGFSFSDILIYRSKDNADFYFLDKEVEELENFLSKNIDAKWIKAGAERYLLLAKELERDMASGRKNIYKKNATMWPLNMTVFNIPHLVIDHKVRIKDDAVSEFCEYARVETEDIFNEVDRYYKKNKIAPVPKFIKGYKDGVKEFIIFGNEFIYDKKVLDDFKRELAKLKDEIQTKEIKGYVASKGKASGVVKIVLTEKDLGKVEEGDVMVATNTNPSYMTAIKKVSAIVTDEGGLLCHAAIVSRELNIPCVIGTKNATAILKDGNLVEVDANNGIVKKV